MFDAKPEDRDKIALYIKEIEIDHRPDRDGNMMQDVRIYFGKQLAPNYEQIYWKSRLKKDNPALWALFGDDLERWEKDQTLPVHGTPLEAWPAISKGQIKACKNLGIRSVEDIASSSDLLREKLGMGGSDLIAKAKGFVANKDQSANANKITRLEEQLAEMQKQLAESVETNKQLAALVKKPRKAEKEAA